LQKLQPNPEIIVDVSHNEQAAKSLLKWLSHHPVKGKTIAVFSVLADKNPKNWVHLFKDTIDMWFISQTISERAMPKQELLKTLSESAQLICSFNTISDAFTQAVNVVDNDDRVLVFGSFYTVSEAMNAYAG
jgi:dihydrofolate synthase/folylpolyglutamate synthase